MKVLEVRSEPFFRRSLSTKEIEELDKWKKYGYSGDTVLFEVQTVKIEIKFENEPGIWQYYTTEPCIFDSASVPDFIPDLVADDTGTLLDQIAAFIHDGEYKTQWHLRKIADGRFKDLKTYARSKKKPGNIIKRFFNWCSPGVFYGAVRTCGWIGYNKLDSTEARESHSNWKDVFKFRRYHKFTLPESMSV
jgi:hypothetical protein